MGAALLWRLPDGGRAEELYHVITASAITLGLLSRATHRRVFPSRGNMYRTLFAAAPECRSGVGQNKEPPHQILEGTVDLRRRRSRSVLPLHRGYRLSWNDSAVLQALYYLMTGLWPLLHIKSFLAVTGPKTDQWLVKTVGVLISVIAAALGVPGARRSVHPELALLGVGSAASLTAVDVIYVARGRISPVYLLDALPELALIAGWLVTRRNR